MRAVPSPANTHNTPLCISWDQGAVTALGVCQPVRAARSGPDNLCCQSHLVSISVSAVPGGQGLVITGSHRYLTRSPAQHFTWSVKTSRQPPDWKGSAALRSKWPTVLISLNCLFFCVILTQCWSRRNISKSSILLLKVSECICFRSRSVWIQSCFDCKAQEYHLSTTFTITNRNLKLSCWQSRSMTEVNYPFLSVPTYSNASRSGYWRFCVLTIVRDFICLQSSELSHTCAPLNRITIVQASGFRPPHFLDYSQQ